MTSNCLTKGSVEIPLADVSLDSVFSSFSPSSMSRLSLLTFSKEDAFTDDQLSVIQEAGLIVQDTISGRSFHSNRFSSMSNSRWRYIALIAMRMTRSIVFQRFILVLCLLHCFMAVYETRPFKDNKTREQCLKASADTGAMTNIFASESVILLFYWAFFFAKVYTRSGKIGGWSMLQVLPSRALLRAQAWRAILSRSIFLQLFVTAVLSIDLIYNWVNVSVNGGSPLRFGTPLRPVIQIVRTTAIAHALRRHLHELYFTVMSAKYVAPPILLLG
jgi:hypothetical protein